jgi:hypothetical protein
LFGGIELCAFREVGDIAGVDDEVAPEIRATASSIVRVPVRNVFMWAHMPPVA